MNKESPLTLVNIFYFVLYWLFPNLYFPSLAGA